MTSPNPNDPRKKEETIREAVASASLGYGWVTNYFPSRNEVEVQPIGSADSFDATLAVDSDGDKAVPHASEEQDLFAVFARFDGHQPIVLSLFYDPSVHEIPSANAGERKLGHQLSETEIYFKADGTLEIATDADLSVNTTGNIILNGGDEGAIYDISTTTDADGHVTSVTPERRGDILL